ncbi:DUF7673 family protein [Rubrimonas cliftonensis]|uniref:DUF7673 domain-containing protein n=1 Tax=Rubrimonas cliftonensis TaxID=89524 RepID=A0A1H4FZ42_9RHOB|nr:hypothetical protein [Rubrimonas cliftonensis]SEB02090.1 hypothetical protein SAMN05444370_1315 [Rubrimonas cliftonensis]
MNTAIDLAAAAETPWGSRSAVLERYAAGVRTLLNWCERNPGSGGAQRCARVLLGCWNGSEHPIDLAGVCDLNDDLRDAAVDVLVGHALTGREAHVFGEEARIKTLASRTPSRR